MTPVSSAQQKMRSQQPRQTNSLCSGSFTETVPLAKEGFPATQCLSDCGREDSDIVAPDFKK